MGSNFVAIVADPTEGPRLVESSPPYALQPLVTLCDARPTLQVISTDLGDVGGLKPSHARVDVRRDIHCNRSHRYTGARKVACLMEPDLPGVPTQQETYYSSSFPLKLVRRGMQP
jgi:hypothetical protein